MIIIIIIIIFIIIYFRESTFDMLSDDTEEDEVDAESSGPLKIPPDITLVLRNRDVKEGGVTKFACRVISKTPLTAEWYKDEQLVSKWPRFTCERDEDLFALNISDAKRTDAGHIRFVARNEFGQVESNAYLNVERKLCQNYRLGALERTAEGHLSAASRQKLNHLVISPFSKCLNVENGGFGLNGYAAGVTCALNYYLVASV